MIRIVMLIICSSTLMFGCQTAKQTSVTSTEKPVTPDPDIVVMQGLGTKPNSSSIMGVKPMSFSELSACATKIDHIQKASTQLKIEQDRLAVWKEKLDKQNKALESDRTKIDNKILKQVQDFNARIEQNRTSVVQYNTDVSSLNDQSSALTLESNEFNTGCANRSYRQSDYLKLPSDIRTAIATKSEISDIPLIEDASNSSLDNPVRKKIHIGR